MRETGGMEIDESRERAVRAALERLLESTAFRTSKRCREFLTYIVERTLGGPSDTLKERSIGVGLFHLPPDFDTGQHTIVRVTANEVRKKLAQYYLAENGSHQPVKIDLPPGSYSPEFKWETPAAAAEAQLPARPSRLSRPVIAGAGSFLVIAAALGLWWWQAPRPNSRNAESSPVPGAVPKPSPDSGDLRIIVGSANPYVDRSGGSWGQDRFFSGGPSSSARPRRSFGPWIRTFTAACARGTSATTFR